MSNKQIIKKVFDNKFDRKEIKNQILLEYERKKKYKMDNLIKYAALSVSIFVIALFVGAILNNKESLLEKDNSGVMKVFAYTYTSEEKLEKKELKDNIKIGLQKYNLAMSSVPGYPINFEIDNLDYIQINVSNGSISLWDKDTYKVSNLGCNYKLTSTKDLYFNVNDKTNIEIKGIKDNKEIFEKNIEISMDDNFNYYALMK